MDFFQSLLAAIIYPYEQFIPTVASLDYTHSSLSNKIHFGAISKPLFPLSNNYKFRGSFEPYVKFVAYSAKFWAQKAGRFGWVSDHYPTAPLIVGFQSLDARAPAPAPSTHYPLPMCVVAWSELPGEASTGTLSSIRNPHMDTTKLNC